MAKIVVDIRTDAATVERLRKFGEVYVADAPPPLQSRERSLPTDALRDAEVLICTVPPANFDDAQRLKFIQLGSVGYAQLYSLNLAERGIRVCNARGVYDTAIAEWNVSMIINLARDLPAMIRNQQQGVWQVADRFAQEVRQGAVGIWGYGGIGRETARLCKALGMQVHVYTRGGIGPRENTYSVPGTGDPKGRLPDRTYVAGEEREFLGSLDFLVLAIPQTPLTTGLLGERELQWLRPSAFLLNPARGPLVEEQALLRALREGWIAGAALDTHYYYPMPADHPLWLMPQVIMTPHISGSDKGPHFLARIWEIVLHNLESFFAGRTLWNELAAEELSGQR